MKDSLIIVKEAKFFAVFATWAYYFSTSWVAKMVQFAYVEIVVAIFERLVVKQYPVEIF